jgi:hypothetical protein
MHDAIPSNSTIKTAYGQFAASLVKRYGSSRGCTRAQVRKTADALALPQEVFPYLCPAFLAAEDYQALQKEMGSINWEEVENRSERIMRELIHTRHTDDDFFESGAAEVILPPS